jgi:hypothetical protein
VEYVSQVKVEGIWPLDEVLVSDVELIDETDDEVVKDDVDAITEEEDEVEVITEEDEVDVPDVVEVVVLDKELLPRLTAAYAATEITIMTTIMTPIVTVRPIPLLIFERAELRIGGIP